MEEFGLAGVGVQDLDGPVAPRRRLLLPPIYSRAGEGVDWGFFFILQTSDGD